MRNVVLDGRYARTLSAFGVDPVAVLRLAGLPEGTFLEASPKVSVEEYYDLMGAVGELVPDEQTLVAMASAEGIEQFSPPVFAAWCSPDGRTCVRRLAQYKRLVGPLALIVTEADDALTVALEPEAGTGRELPRFVVLTEIVLITHLLRAATGRQVVPAAVTMRDPCPPDGAVTAFLGVTPVRGTADVVTFGWQDVSAPFVTRNDAMWAYVEPEMRRRLSDLGAGQSATVRVEAALVELLPAGRYGVEDVARTLAVSPRTLQRRLSEEGTSFAALLARIRERLARHYLSATDMTSHDVAFLLGYAEPNSFHRAFRAWTGTTVGRFRAQEHGAPRTLVGA